jgi:methoxymalonate biosynthesis acyl carrier protein
MIEPAATTANVLELEGRIRKLFLEALDIGIDSVETDLVEAGLLDSLMLVELLLQLEQEFDIDVVMADLEIDDFRTLKSIATFVTRLRTGGGAR